MGIKSTLTSLVARRHAEPDTAVTTVAPPCDKLELRLAPYTVTETSISIPRQRSGSSRADDAQILNQPSADDQRRRVSSRSAGRTSST